MPIPKSDKIWINGTFVDWDDARIHVLSHVVHYGSSVFEGMRCYETPEGPACFRLTDHVNRLFDSAKIYRMPIPCSKEEVADAITETIRVNKMRSCYVRPVVYRGYGEIGVDPTDCPVDVVVAVWEWGKYLGPEALEKGVSVRFASWNRLAPNTMPSLASTSRLPSPSSPYRCVGARFSLMPRTLVTKSELAREYAARTNSSGGSAGR